MSTLLVPPGAAPQGDGVIRIGVNLAAVRIHSASGNLLDDLVATARAAAAAGVSTGWLPQGFGHDAPTALAAIARDVPRIELGASVVVVQPRHPRVLAAQAQTAQAASGGRFVLGLGVSHPGLLEPYGIPFRRPLAALREHLDTLLPILAGDRVPDPTGVGVDPAQTTVPGGAGVPVLLGALGPRMLALAGERTDGTITFLAGPRTIGEHVVPLVTAAAGSTARPRVVVGLPVSVTADPDRVRAQVAADYAGLAALPSYRAALDRDGFPDAGAMVIAGTEEEVAAGLARYADLGATDGLLSLVGDAAERERTLRVLGEIAQSSMREPITTVRSSGSLK
jgi:F420-dependent oxidoreductase-like protein